MVKQSQKLSDVITLIGGGTPKRSISEYWNGNIPWLSVKDFNHGDNRYVEKSQEKITLLGLEKSSTKLLKPGMLIISARGTVGELAQLKSEMAFNQSCYGIDAKNEFLENDYLYYLLKLKIRELKSIAHGSVFDTITRDTFDSIQIDLPSKAKQKTIAHILGTLDDKIELNQKMNDTLEETAKAIFKSWFVDFDPVRAKMAGRSTGLSDDISTLFPDKLVGSEIGEIPNGWDAVDVGNCFNCFDSKRVPLSGNERAKRGGSFPYYGATGIIDYLDDYIFDGTYLLIGEDGSVERENGTAFSQYITGKIWVNNHAHVLQGKNGISTEFLFLYFQFIRISPYVTGAVQLKISQSNLRRIPIVKPNQELLDKFQNMIALIFEKKLLIEKENKILSDLRDTLLPKLISGELKILDAEKFLLGAGV